MTEKNKTEESIRFVTGHYVDDTLLPRQGWQRFRLTHHISSLRRNLAAACIGAAVLAASAASIYYFYSSTAASPAEETTITPASETVMVPANISRKIEFHDAPLREVAAEIERVYDVEISNVPRQEMSITISYEGTAADVVETINDLLDIHLTVKPKPESASRE